MAPTTGSSCGTRDPASRARHEQLGFFDGWGTVTEQLAGLVERPGRLPMRLTLTQFVTLDGVYQGPGSPDEDPSDGFTRGGWMVPHMDQTFIAQAAAWLGRGRRPAARPPHVRGVRRGVAPASPIPTTRSPNG